MTDYAPPGVVDDLSDPHPLRTPFAPAAPARLYPFPAARIVRILPRPAPVRLATIERRGRRAYLVRLRRLTAFRRRRRAQLVGMSLRWALATAAFAGFVSFLVQL